MEWRNIGKEISWFTLGVCGCLCGAMALMDGHKLLAIILVFISLAMLIKGTNDDNKMIINLMKEDGIHKERGD